MLSFVNMVFSVFFFFKQKTAYEMRISDWSSDVCSSDLPYETVVIDVDEEHSGTVVEKMAMRKAELTDMRPSGGGKTRITFSAPSRGLIGYHGEFLRSEEHTSELQSLMRI